MLVDNTKTRTGSITTFPGKDGLSIYLKSQPETYSSISQTGYSSKSYYTSISRL